MITIVKPHSVYADRTDANEFELEWSSTVSGQTGYEIYYKLSNAANWSTTGLISDPTATTYDLRQIYTLLEIDFTEIIYKIKLYYSTENEEGLLTGVEESDIYTIIFSQPISGYVSVYDGNEIERYPLFDAIESSDYDKFNVQTNDGKLSTILVDDASPIASNMKICVGSDNLTLASEYASNLAYTQNAHGEFEQDGYETEYYYYNSNEQTRSYSYRTYVSDYYYYTYRTYTYTQTYTYVPKYYYKYSYSYVYGTVAYVKYYYGQYPTPTYMAYAATGYNYRYGYNPSDAYYRYYYDKGYYYYEPVYDQTYYYRTPYIYDYYYYYNNYYYNKEDTYTTPYAYYYYT